MTLYLTALGAGVLVGIIYGVLQVRSPAPPVVALVGLLGILAGEQIVPLARRVLEGRPVDLAWIRSGCLPHVFGRLPGADRGPDGPA
ncbi:XapX domain-containing protein [Humitalea rosea]|uniref:XapX domain-containing protein n=1 Tax=Humitalea rosea TaxID=990373 RepID=A0A2W7IQN0_9PROT|nr:XapX domain-containing protein [Humitalea rosea]PZW48271.1 XapX domain-containing protein [Humitalea rosea]